MTDLDDIVVRAVEIPAVRAPGSGDLLLAAAEVPAGRVDAGCVVRYAAPGGCLGRVEVSPVTVPGLRLKGVRTDRVRIEPLELPPVTRPGAAAPQVCRQTVEDRELGVTRRGVVREGFSRPGGARPGFGDSVAAARVPAVSVRAVDIDPVRLQTRRLPGARSEELEDADRTSFVAPAQVLFATDSAALRPAAYPELRAIARQVAARAPGKPVLVEGHTDDRGSAAYGLRLSRARAEAVARWLQREGGIPGKLLRTRGLGESSPVVPNTSPENRQRNRRVVISIPR